MRRRPSDDSPAILAAAVFAYVASCPLWHTDVWGHLAYGRWMLGHGRLPETEPLMPLAAGVPAVWTAWLSQAGAAWLCGEIPTELPLLAAGCVSVAVFCVGRTASIGAGTVWGAPLAVAVFLLVEYRQLFAGAALFEWFQPVLIRPQMAGLALFAAVTGVAFRRRPRPLDFLTVPLLFVLWANLHGSWPMGLLLLGTATVGAAVDRFRRTGRLERSLKCPPVVRFGALTGLAAAAVLVNPYGPDLYREVFTFDRSPNLAALVEWRPISLAQRQGWAAATVALAWLVAVVISPRRKSALEILAVVGLGLLTLKASRFLVWWGPVVAVSLASHLAGVVARLFPGPIVHHGFRLGPRPLRIALEISLVAVAVATYLVAAGRHIAINGDTTAPPPPENTFGRCGGDLPFSAIKSVRYELTEGTIWAPYEWGDALLWAGPYPVFVASHAHLIPPDVWRDYLTVSRFCDGWREVLVRRGVTVVLADRRRNRRLVEALEGDPSHWAETHRDERAIVFRRITRKPEA